MTGRGDFVAYNDGLQVDTNELNVRSQNKHTKAMITMLSQSQNHGALRRVPWS